MNIFNDPQTLILIGSVLMVLGVAWGIVWILKRRPESGINPAILETFRLRVRSWWILFAVLAAALLLPSAWPTIVLFGLISFWALREFITITPTRPGDHRTLFCVLFLITPLQFVLVALGCYGWYSIMIPVYAFLLIPASIALAGDYKRFLERTAKIQCGLLICVYCLSYAPALLTLRAATAATEGGLPLREPACLLFFFVLIVQLSDALQYAWSQLPNRHVIVPTINTARTWEGLLGGTASVMLIGAALWWVTPFQGGNWWKSPLLAAVISLMGFAGSITMSAIKRDRGVKDYGTLVEGHGGVLDRIDSLCFAAPVFFHCARWWLGG